ncbi:flavin reductase family protein [Candidatus Nitrosocosmicus hydrocola]|uniref:flavin reductase family protein n=1 Tax=Candidatus Nitrosocosmicus hydrocola TaxID=1826872 RepID=UPI0011E5B55E|nr:flavin reductase family protein [Candidatus Nitrosocosmicus hydrocola]
MDLPWGSSSSNKFATTIGLITSNGPYHHNIMACEWTHHLSYSPGLVAVSLSPTKATVKNIQSSKEFGVNLCSTSQSILSSVSGGYSGRKYDKISALKELGFQFYQAKKTNTLMVKEASLNIECKLFNEITFGDHIMLIGEVLDATSNPEKQSLIYHNGKYWSMQEVIKPSQEERERIKNILEKHTKNNHKNLGD